ncbi:contractile injection system protein, VgrG/Pvc8 family [Paenibacillus woosongensis]|uniref:Contractile injection system protein, VgrG/Pvc8 family n=1 Tax=Paenibacillus woosongensis TaxID=307580 RepID=A0AA95ID92_9BACL|nr:phage baseplate assembly protein V [Paenibacillus woosongensis]WHX50163.1 contractile injection system protein, VgrG/Pvc8 family [Paenibacillus woosongensis]
MTTTISNAVGSIRIEPYEILHLHSMKITKGINKHSKMTFSAIVSEDKKDAYVTNTNAETFIRALIQNDDGQHEHILFTGLVTKVRVNAARGVYYLNVEAISHSYLLDIKRKKRSFQNPDILYSSLIKEVISPYQDADIIDAATFKKKTNTLIMQYEETDWQFLKRMASRFYTALVPVNGYDSPKLYFGVPTGQDKGELQTTYYTVHKNMAEFKEAIDNSVPGVSDSDYTVYDVISEQLLEPGHEVTFKKRRLVVGSVVSETRNGILEHNYKLYPRKGLRQKKIHNEAIIGASIQGKVIQVHRDTVRAKLDMDDQLDANSNYWFPYSTIYASEDNTGWYCMPEIGDSIRIYFPSKKEEEGIAISSVAREIPSKPASVSGGQTTSQASVKADKDPKDDPDTKTFSTKYGKIISLGPSSIIIKSGDMFITLDDERGIDIVSNKDISITADNNILLASSSIHISANTLSLSNEDNKITLEEANILIEGTEIKMN